jgi:hypothetical protein
MPAKKLSAVRRLMPHRAKLHSAKKTAATRRVRQDIHTKRTVIGRLLLHPLSTFGMMLIGVLLAGLTYQALAADYSVNAVVQAEQLTEGAVITSPKAGQILTTTPIHVAGTCPNTSYVKLLRNGAFSGVAFCNNGTFSIDTDLFQGANDLQAQDYNITDVAGPQTPVVHVVYQPPVTPAPPKTGTTKSSAMSTRTSTNTSTNLSVKPPLLIQGDYHFNVATTGSVFTWQLNYQYADPPVATTINWGDNTSESLTVPSNDPFKIQHTYKTSGYYPVVVQGIDASQRTVMIQLVAFIKKPGDAATKGSILPTQKGPNDRGSGGLSKFKWLLYAWPTYAIIVVMVGSFWLGERRELLMLTKTVHHATRRRVRHS